MQIASELIAIAKVKHSYSPRLVSVDTIEGEEWRIIPIPSIDLEDPNSPKYYASNLGRIKKEFILKSGKYISSLMKPVPVNGRLTIGLTIRSTYVIKTYVAKLVLLAFIPPTESIKQYVKHLDGDTSNCKLDNLEWSSKYSASQAIIDGGNRARKLKTKEYINKLGKKVYKQVQFSAKDYEEMIFLYKSGLSQCEIAKQKGCTQSFVSQVILGKFN